MTSWRAAKPPSRQALGGGRTGAIRKSGGSATTPLAAWRLGGSPRQPLVTRVHDDRRRPLRDHQGERGAREVHAFHGGAARELDVAAEAAGDTAGDGEAHAD